MNLERYPPLDSLGCAGESREEKSGMGKNGWGRPIALVGTGMIALACGSARNASSPEVEGARPRAIASTVTAVRVEAGTSPAMFVADVPAVREGGECMRLPPLRGEGFRLVFVVGDPASPERRIQLTYNAAGELTDYADERGDLKAKVVGPDGKPPRPGEPVRMVPPAGRRTSIHINLVQGMGLAMNDGGGEPREAVGGSAEEMLQAESLDRPLQMIERVEQECGGKP